MRPDAFNLSLEQQFELQRLKSDINRCSREQAIELLIKAHELLMMRDNIIRDLIRDKAGVEFSAK